ncbi:MAG TPA: Tim44-like domain-containing protein [Burkholderiales bacterium]|nr:Tim44-like domain-containing protein [Burkholderiales bacterium]
MTRFLLGLTAALLCAAFIATDADAKRLGGSRSIGSQRSITSAPPAAAPAKPAQQAAPASTPAGAQPQPASGLSRWAPLLGGLALGGALGWLMGANGMGGALVGMLLAGLLVFAMIAVMRLLTQKRGEAPQRFQYAGIGSETVAAPPPSQAAGFDVKSTEQPARTNVPDGFDVAGFLKSAKLNYMRLQIANDQGNLEELREFTSDELFEELRKDVIQRGSAKQHTDVLALNADLLEVVTEGDKHWASIRFSGTLRESPGDAPQGFEEVWNLAKPVNGPGGWQLAGIQQMH